ncbi:hypothetical protein OsI_19624 [Oryza sativa Indica Group]|uniref:Uncharacterized protein n=1 Tax=Oryza sativa subsp. indica TaxID=39946 RepID=A2Y3P3_ORYSI|nr:hypothetical protein OsI_19624 [Oryza sativa Indica Group]
MASIPTHAISRERIGAAEEDEEDDGPDGEEAVLVRGRLHQPQGVAHHGDGSSVRHPDGHFDSFTAGPPAVGAEDEEHKQPDDAQEHENLDADQSQLWAVEPVNHIDECHIYVNMLSRPRCWCTG